MQSLPLIRLTGTNPNASVKTKNKRVSTSDRPSFGAKLHAHGTTASASDGINRNQLRQEAGRRVQHITHGVAEQQTYLNMLQHIREQFAHTSQQPLQPLVLPPQWPSTARPREPQTAKFSRGIALYKGLQQRNSAALLPPASSLSTKGEDYDKKGEGGIQGEAGATIVVSKTKAPSVKSAAGVSGDAAADVPAAPANTAAASTASYVPTELPSTSTNFARAHRWETMGTDDRSFFQRRWPDILVGDSGTTVEGESNSSSVGRRDSADFLHEVDLSPLDELPTLAEKVLYLSDLESASRQHVMAYEKWDLQVVSEMMAVHYVTFVLKPCMDALRIEETEEREKIYQREDRDSFYLFHESPLVVAIAEEIKAMKAREMQLDRILSVTAAQERRSQPSGSTDNTSVPLAKGPVGRSRSAYVAFCAPSRPSLSTTTPTTGTNANNSSGGVIAPEARRILQRYVRQRHGIAIDAAAVVSPLSPSATPKTWAPASSATYPSTVGRDLMRCSSALMLPPLPSVHAPRRNAVGIADYVALLDEYMQLRDRLIQGEQQSRDDLNRACYEEQQVVLEWQRRRMHLERLMYWRHQREEAVQEELSALTEVNVGAPLDPKVALLLELLEGQEEDARTTIELSEQRSRQEEIWATDAALRYRRARLQLEEVCWTTFQKGTQAAEAVARQHLILDEEESIRHCMEDEALTSLGKGLSHGMAQLRVLWEVSISPEHGAALQVLQSAFRQSLRGKLGWRATNNAVGREINDARNAKKISSGKRTLQSFKDTLAAEEAQLLREQEVQNVHEQHVLFTGEVADRLAICSEQDLIRQGMYRASVLHVAEVYKPVFQRFCEAEQKARMQVEVEEEVNCVALRTSHAALTLLITRKARIRYDETAARKTLVAEERVAWRELLGVEAETLEELRLDAETKVAMLQADRIAFVTASFQASRNYREGAFNAYVRQMTEVALEMLGYSSSDSAERWAICAEESRAATQLFAELMLQACEMYAQTLWYERQTEMNRTHRLALCAGETETRADILLSEAVEWEALKPLLMDALSGPLRDLILRRGAVNAISTWYRSVRNGDIGREVSRRQLRDDLARYREERDLREHQITQRLHTQQVRDQLDMLMREIQQEEVEALQQRLDILVHREEPRGRDEVESMQEIVFGIIVRNAGAHTAEVRSQLVNTEALLWQQELYERKLLVKASRRELKGLMEWGRQQLSGDYFAARIQRTWAAYAMRKKQAQVAAEQRERLIALEQQARAAVQLEELEMAALQLYKPCDVVTFFYIHVRQSLGHVYEKLCLTVLAATSAREWQERASLLWEMRYDLCDFCLCSEEERARRTLAVEFDRPFVLQEELVLTEEQERRLLEKERIGFLLRILVREEQAHRQVVAAEEAGELSEVQKGKGSTQPPGPQGL